MPKYDDCKLTRSASIAAPAVRMAVLSSFATRDDSGHWKVGRDVLPVLALVAEVVSEFCRSHRPGDHRRPGTEADLERDGWHHQGTGTEFDVLIYSGEYGGPCTARFALQSVNEAFKVVVCPWPPGEDEARFAPLFEAVDAEAVGKAERDEEHRQKAARPPDGRPRPSESRDAPLIIPGWAPVLPSTPGVSP